MKKKTDGGHNIPEEDLREMQEEEKKRTSRGFGNLYRNLQILRADGNRERIAGME